MSALHPVSRTYLRPALILAVVLLIPHLVNYALAGYTDTMSIFPWGIGFLAFLVIVFMAISRIRQTTRQGVVSWSSAWWDGALISGYAAGFLALALGALYAASPSHWNLPRLVAFVFLGVWLIGVVWSLVCAVVVERRPAENKSAG